MTSTGPGQDDAEERVVPADAARGVGVVRRRDLVGDLGRVGERLEAVREARAGRRARAAVLGAQLHRRPTAGRSASRGAGRRRRRRARPACSARASPPRRAAPGSGGRAACPAGG